ncbi:MAG TPA: TIGR02449 family protein [Thiothrix sp.]|nr:TIGR02449 family protein [Thiothrix sp.]
MTEETTDKKLDMQIGLLEDRLHEVLVLLEALSSENTALKARESSLLAERSELHNKNSKVRSQVESMIQRLKTMDNS